MQVIRLRSGGSRSRSGVCLRLQGDYPLFGETQQKLLINYDNKLFKQPPGTEKELTRGEVD